MLSFDFEGPDPSHRLVSTFPRTRFRFRLGIPSLFSLFSPVQLHCYGLGKLQIPSSQGRPTRLGAAGSWATKVLVDSF